MSEEYAKEVAEKLSNAKVKQEENLEKQKEFYRLLRQGGLFLKFVFEDLKQKGFDRNSRRRIMKELQKGKFSEEMIDIYIKRIDEILLSLEKK